MEVEGGRGIWYFVYFETFKERLKLQLGFHKICKHYRDSYLSQ